MDAGMSKLLAAAIDKPRADRDVVALAELAVDAYNFCKQCPGEARKHGLSAAAMLRSMKALFKDMARRACGKCRKQEASALVLAMDALLWEADGFVLRDYGHATLLKSLAAGIVNEYESGKKRLLSDAEYFVHLLGMQTFLDAEKKLKERKVRKALAKWFNGYAPEKGWADCGTATALWRLRARLDMDSRVKPGDYDEMFGVEAGRVIDCDKSRWATDELLALGGMVDRLVKWYVPSEAQANASRMELKAELEKRLGGEYGFAVECRLAQLDLAQRAYDEQRQKKAAEDAAFGDEMLAPILGVKIAPELSDAEMEALATAYANRHDIASSFGETYDSNAIRYCHSRMSELYLALLEKEQATGDACRQAACQAAMAELGMAAPNSDLDLTFKQLSYPFDRMEERAGSGKPLAAEAEALLVQVATADMCDTPEEEWLRLTAIADRWAAEYAADKWSGLDEAAVLARGKALTALSANMEDGSEKRAKYKGIAEAAAEDAAGKMLAAGKIADGAAGQLLSVRLYRVAEMLHGESDGFFSGESPWRDAMRSIAAGLAAHAPDSLAARAIAVAEAAWIAKTDNLADYR